MLHSKWACKPLTTTANVVAILWVLRMEEGDEIPFISIEFGSGLDV